MTNQVFLIVYDVVVLLLAAQLLRDVRTPMFIIGPPLIGLFLFAYAVSQTVYHLPTVVADQIPGVESRKFIQASVNSQYFDVAMSAQNESQVHAAIDASQVKAGVVIPPDFSNQLKRGDANVLILLDGIDPFSVQSGFSAAMLVSQNYRLTWTVHKSERTDGRVLVIAQASLKPIRRSFRVLYNPALENL